jgi:hypothetical protein
VLSRGIMGNMDQGVRARAVLTRMA